MLSRVDIKNEKNEILSLPLQDVSSGYVVQSIDGLDPGQATMATSSYATLDGDHYQNSRRQTRNIIMTLGLEAYFGGGTVQQLRANLYKYAMPKSAVTLSFFMEDGSRYDIAARVETVAAPMFVREPAVAISFLCHSPDFVDPNFKVVSGVSTDVAQAYDVMYNGNVPTGAIINFNANKAVNRFTVRRTWFGDIQEMEFVAPIASGQTVSIFTTPGAKAVLLRPAVGEATNLLYGIVAGSEWITVMPGLNSIRVYNSGGGVPFTFRWNDMYGGL